MFGYDNVKTFSVVIGDPGADAAVALLVAPKPLEIVSLKLFSGRAITAGDGTAVVLTVYNGGTVGTATTVVGTAIGGTTTDYAVGIQDFSLGDGTMSADQVLWAKYDETGTVAPFIVICGEYIEGVAA